MMGADPRMARDHGKSKPTAEIYVAYGRLCEGQSVEPKMPTLQQQAMRDEARRSYQKAIEIEPNASSGYLALGEYYMATDDLERALQVCQNGLKKQPKEPKLWSQQGFCQCRKKNWEAAVESFRKANQLDRDNREYATELGYCLARAGRVEESLACLTQVLGAAQAHYNVARMLERLNRPDLSKQHLQLALQVRPDLAPAQEMLARLEGPLPPAGDHGVVQIGFQQPAQ
jgi:tetratricopeptide (TPR) repeat protein